MDISILKERLTELKRRKDLYKRLKREYEEAKKKHDILQAEIFSFMGDHEFGALNHEGVDFIPKETVYGYVQDPEAFEAWCKENQVEDIYLKTEEEKQRINEIVRESLDTGSALPPGVTFYVRQYITLTEKK